MTAREQGFLLLTGTLGDPNRHPLTAAQLRTLAARAQAMASPLQERELCPEDLLAIGYDRGMAEQIIALLSHTEQLEQYLHKGSRQDCFPITRLSAAYPPRLRKVLGSDCPGALWAKGDPALLQRPAIALVGCRELCPENQTFAWEAGRQAALRGYVLVSGNARGADRAAQQGCLEHGGCVISVIADALEKYPLQRRVLYLSENGFDLGFSAQRALSRNRIIHALGQMTFVAQTRLRKGGTWDGTVKNLRHGWSPVFCFADGSAGTEALVQHGAAAITLTQLKTSALPDIK